MMNTRLREAWPAMRGKWQERAPLKDFLWFRVGGPAEFLFRPADEEDLCAFLAAKGRSLHVSVIGVGSNLLVRDGGIRGAVIRLPSSFGRCTVEKDRVRAGAAALDAGRDIRQQVTARWPEYRLEIAQRAKPANA